MRNARDLVVWTAMWIVLAYLTSLMSVGPQQVGIVSIIPGVAAGLFVALPRDRWWPVVASAAPVIFVFATRYLEFPWWLAVVRALTDLLSAAAFAWIILRFRSRTIGLGAPLTWVAMALAGAVLIRGVGLVASVACQNAADEFSQRVAWLEYVLATLNGFFAGVALVLGLAAWRRGYREFPGSRLEFVGGFVVAAVFVELILFTPVGRAFPGALFLVVPVLLFAAIRAPVAVTSVLTGGAVLSAAVAAGQHRGPFEHLDLGSVNQVLTLQVAMLVFATSIYLLAATVADRRMAEVEAMLAAERMQAVFDQSPVATAWVTTKDGRPVRIREANPAFRALLGLDDDTARASLLSDVLVDPTTHEPIDPSASFDFPARSPDGIRWLRPTVSEPIAGGDGMDLSAVLTLEDVTTARASEELMRQHMRRDSLTGLPNRLTFVERLDEALASRRPDAHLGLVIVGIDGLKALNDGMGHSAGDQAIVQVGRRLSGALEPGDQILRVGGDEFAIIASRAVGGETLQALADRLIAIIREPIQIDDVPIAVTASAGAVVADDQRTIAADLLRGADVALARAERDGRDRAALFSPGEDENALQRLAMADRIRHALSHDELFLVYQPIVAIATGAVTSAEALVRMRDASGTTVAPNRFLPFAAEIGLLGAITEQVLEKACAAAETWLNAGTEVRVGFNVPPRWLNATTVQRIAESIVSHHLPWSLMTLEVTEEETLDLDADMVDALNLLRVRGMHIAIDDFGTGYSGLDSFRSIPADVVKIDMSFIADMLRSDQDRDFVRSMIDLIHRFGKLALAEGVEAPAQLEALRQMGCEFAQGYLLSRPVPFEQFPAGRVLAPATLVSAR